MPVDKVLRGVLVPVLFSLAPAGFHPALLGRVEPWIGYLTGVILILTQPSIPFSPGAKEYRDPKDRFSALAIHCTIFFAAMIAAIHFVLRPLELGSNIRSLALAAGLFLAVAGLALRIWSIRTLGKCFTATVRINPDHKLIQSGPYRWIRHPSYLGATAAVTAPAIIYGALWVAFFTTIILLGTYAYRIRVEESALRQRFGADYDNYVRRVGALFPKLFGLTKNSVS